MMWLAGEIGRVMVKCLSFGFGRLSLDPEIILRNYSWRNYIFLNAVSVWIFTMKKFALCGCI